MVAAVAFGKGLSKCRPPGPVAPGHPGQGPIMGGGPTLQQVTIGGVAGQQAGLGGPVAPQQQGQPGRRPGLGFPPGSDQLNLEHILLLREHNENYYVALFHCG